MISKKLLLFLVSAFFIVSLIGALFITKSDSSQSTKLFWPIESIDTMKYSRDPSRDPQIFEKIPAVIKEVADLHANYVAIATPYDEEFYPVLKAWVDEARKYNLHIWFRGNFSGWEGWFGYAKFANISQHNSLTKKFIVKHPDLFELGDIFTPVPEPENGGMGDPRGSDVKIAKFNQLLIDSYNNCTESFKLIHKSILCGYFSMNGDIAKQVLTNETVKKTGNIVVIDHYVNSAQKMGQDLSFLTNKFPGAHILIGEFGAPIPDINGNMTEREQADFVSGLLAQFVLHKSVVEGINYWVVLGGSTALYNDDGSQRQAAKVVTQYYNPPLLTGTVKDPLGAPIPGVSLKTSDGLGETVSGQNGTYAITIMPKYQNIVVKAEKPGYNSTEVNATISLNGNKNIQDIIMTNNNSSLLYKIRLFIRERLLL